MKEKQEENDNFNNDEDNEKLTPMKFESFNVSLPENEIITPKKTKTGIIFLLILIVFIIFITIYILTRSKKKISCPKGYFIPDDPKYNDKCFKCSVENCEECHGTILLNICSLCKPYLTPIIDKGQIKYCKYTCETGINEKCKECDEFKNECSSCNTGFKLQNGKCIINYSIKATYITEYKNQSVKLLNNHQKEISNMIVDDINITSPSKKYNFPNPGNHTIYFLMDTSNIFSLDSFFKECTDLVSLSFTELFDTSKVKNMSEMFYYCTILTSLDISKFNTKQVLDMSKMFSTCLKLTSLEISNFDTSLVTTMNEIFKLDSFLTSLNLNNFNTKNVLDMGYMFYGCSKLKYINISSSFDTSKVIKMNGMFILCSSLTSINISNFNTKNVDNMEKMFSNCWKLTSLNLSHFNTEKVKNMKDMFSSCNSLLYLDISKINTNNV